MARERFNAFSAGSDPKGQVNPFSLKVLQAHGYPAEGFRSKSWDEFAAPGAPPLDIIITVCDNAAGETCPIWPGHPVTAHWGIEDPAAVTGSDADKFSAFETAFRHMQARIAALLSLPIAALDIPALRSALNAIGNMEGATHG